MSWSPCPWCGAPLEGYDGSPCTAPGCINSRGNRDREPERFLAPLSGQVTTAEPRTREQERARKAKRKAARLARRRNRGRS